MHDNKNPHLPILIIDDDPDIQASFEGVLESAGFNNLMGIEDPRKVLSNLSKNYAALVLLDLTMPQISGIALLEEIHEAHPDLPIIVVTGDDDLDTAVQCMREGAMDYLVKPVEDGRLITTVQRVLEIQELRTLNEQLRSNFFDLELKHPEHFAEIVTNDRQMTTVFRYIEAISQTSRPVLITGETGTGKELIAKSVHHASGRGGKYIAADIAGFDDTMFTDTLFGHVKGAFTGADAVRKGLIETAAQGTIFLDEIGDLSMPSQVKLLRLIEDGSYFPLGGDLPKRSTARIVAATNRDLAKAVGDGSFRQDLFFRIKVHRVELPRLCDRRADISLLTNHFIREASEELGRQVPDIPPQLYTYLGNYSFPGNIRELRNIIFNAIAEHRSGTLSLSAFKVALGTVREDTNTEDVVFPQILPSIKKMNELLISEAMKRAENNRTIASKMLGITPQALGKRLNK